MPAGQLGLGALAAFGALGDAAAYWALSNHQQWRYFGREKTGKACHAFPPAWLHLSPNYPCPAGPGRARTKPKNRKAAGHYQLNTNKNLVKSQLMFKMYN